MSQMDLFDSSAGIAARDSAMAATDDAHSAQLRSDWMDVIEWICLTHAEFTTDEVVREGQRRGLDKPREFRVLGAWMSSARSKGWCERTERTRPSERVNLHRAPRRIWRSAMIASPTITCPTCDGRGTV